MNKTIFNIILILLVFSNSYSQDDQVSEKSESIIFEGIIDTADKDNFELSECIANSAMIMGIESKTETIDSSKESSFVKGQYSYSYYVNDYEKQAGIVEFKFEYIVKNEKIHFKIYDFIHRRGDSEFDSLGLLPKKWNERIGKTFTEKQYDEIMADLVFNALNSLRMIKKYCIK
tara:strand:+ start:114 stop:635 length:522 start_codon:yes stop_codon:yes gene_type:complete